VVVRIPVEIRTIEEASTTAYLLALVGLGNLCPICEDRVPFDLTDEIDVSRFCEDCRIGADAVRLLAERLVDLGEGQRATAVIDALRPGS